MHVAHQPAESANVADRCEVGVSAANPAAAEGAAAAWNGGQLARNAGTGMVHAPGGGERTRSVPGDQGRRGGHGAASPEASTRTFTWAGPRQMLPAMTRGGSQG